MPIRWGRTRCGWSCFTWTPRARPHPVALLDVTNSAANGLRDDHLIDFTAASPMLALADAAVAKEVQVLVTTVGDAGGFFDIDNVRVSAAVPEPAGLGAWVLAMAVAG